MAKARKSSAPRRPLALTAEQDALLTEMATLVYYSDRFTYTKPMMKLVKSIADRATPAAQHACIGGSPGLKATGGVRRTPPVRCSPQSTSIIRGIIMFEARSTTAKIRFPVEFLAVVDEYAAAHGLPRSVAVRRLVMHGFMWESQPQQQPALQAA
jgi:hypothetical protein